MRIDINDPTMSAFDLKYRVFSLTTERRSKCAAVVSKVSETFDWSMWKLRCHTSRGGEGRSKCVDEAWQQEKPLRRRCSYSRWFAAVTKRQPSKNSHRKRAVSNCSCMPPA